MERPLPRLLRWIRFLDRIQTKTEFVSKTYEQAALSLISVDTFTDIRYKKKQTISHEDVHPKIVEFWKAFNKACTGRKIPLLPYELFRSEQRQNSLFRKGVSKAKAGQSPHQFGCAIDIVHYPKFWNLTRKEWDVLGAIGKEVARKRNIKIEWGGDWSFYDPAHWQLVDWRIYKAAIQTCRANEIILPIEPKAKFEKLDLFIKKGGTGISI